MLQLPFSSLQNFPESEISPTRLLKYFNGEESDYIAIFILILPNDQCKGQG